MLGRGSRKGFVMVAALVILMALTVMGIVMISTATLESRISGIEKENTQSVFLAEVGVTQVREWFQWPERFTPIAGGFTTGVSVLNNAFKDCAGQNIDVGSTAACPNVALSAATEQNFFRRRYIDIDTGKREYISNAVGATWSQFVDTNGNGTQDVFNSTDTGAADIPALTIENQGYLNSLFSDFSPAGRVISIKIYPPMSNPQSGRNVERPRAICTVRVMVETSGGIIKTVESEIHESVFLTIDAGAQTGGAGQWNGNGTINWGQIKALGDVALNRGSLPVRCGAGADPWFKATIGGCFMGPGGCNAGGPAVPDNLCPGTPDCIGCAGINGVSNDRPYQDLAVYQNQPGVTLDKWEKADMQDYAETFGSYYRVDTATNQVYKSNSDGAVLGPVQAFNTTWLKNNQDPFLYLDAPGAPINLGITGSFYREGDIYIDGSVSVSGGGSGTTISVTDPGGTPRTLNDINFKGVLYMTGSFSGNGSPKIFGGLVAETGLSSSGNPQVWYDIELEDGRRSLPKSGKGMWREIM
ncbi:MAG: hypothetical protein Q8J64_05200 [Thermodesulfovibrionales bacterium]|nr:hypothetical protein [Thermodesulfovibrionales bacterium]